MPALHLAAVQLNIQWEDRRATHERIRQLLANTDLPPNTLVVLPEMFDTGFSMNTRVTDPGEPSAELRAAWRQPCQYADSARETHRVTPRPPLPEMDRTGAFE